MYPLMHTIIFFVQIKPSLMSLYWLYLQWIFQYLYDTVREMFLLQKVRTDLT